MLNKIILAFTLMLACGINLFSLILSFTLQTAIIANPHFIMRFEEFFDNHAPDKAYIVNSGLKYCKRHFDYQRHCDSENYDRNTKVDNWTSRIVSVTYSVFLRFWNLKLKLCQNSEGCTLIGKVNIHMDRTLQNIGRTPIE